MTDKGNVKWTRRAIAQRETVYLAIPKEWAIAHDVERYSEPDIFAMGDGSLRILKHREEK
jgi:hypothetical protein